MQDIKENEEKVNFLKSTSLSVWFPGLGLSFEVFLNLNLGNTCNLRLVLKEMYLKKFGKIFILCHCLLIFCVSLFISSQNLYVLGPFVLLTPTLCRPKLCGCIWYCFLPCPQSGVVQLYIMQEISIFLIVSLIIDSLAHLSCWKFLSSFLFILVVVGFFHSRFFSVFSLFSYSFCVML